MRSAAKLLIPRAAGIVHSGRLKTGGGKSEVSLVWATDATVWQNRQPSRITWAKA